VAGDADDDALERIIGSLEELGGAMPELVGPSPRVRPPMAERLPERGSDRLRGPGTAACIARGPGGAQFGGGGPQ